MASDAEKNAGWLGWLCIAFGLFFLAGAFGIVPLEPAGDTPIWVVGMCGVVFAVAGVMILLGPQSPMTSLGAAILCAAFGAIGSWVALFAAPESISGGLPFVSAETNGKIGKVFFGLGALMSFAIAGVAWRQFRRSRSDE